MTVADWESGDDLWDRFNPWKNRDREKLRALCCASSRRVLAVAGLAARPGFFEVVDVAERYAAGRAARKELLAARKLLLKTVDELRGTGAKHQSLITQTLLDLTDDSVEGFEHMLVMAGEVLGKFLGAKGFRAERPALSGLVRDIFGNPFRPVAFDPTWRTETVVALARGMYDAGDFGPMPVLADALDDAGCDTPDLLAHCRDPQGVHVRGCWVVDLVLGKA